MKKTIEIDVSGKKIPIEVEIPSPIEELNEFLSNRKAVKLLQKGFDIRTVDDDIPHISNLKGVKKVTSPLFLVDKTMVSIYCKGTIDKEKIIATFPLSHVKLAIELGMETINIMEKDYPCICADDDELLIIAPIVGNK